MSILTQADTNELLKALRNAGINKNNIGSHTCLYVENGIIKATNNSGNVIPDLDEYGYPQIENVGFWRWCSDDDYEKATEGFEDDIHAKIRAGFEVNLEALKKML